MLLAKAAMLGIVEELIEFFPISSTRHLITESSLLRLDYGSVQVFEIMIQPGVMSTVIWHYRTRLAAISFGPTSDQTRRRFACDLLLAFVPQPFSGCYSPCSSKHFFNPTVVAVAFSAVALFRRGGGDQASPTQFHSAATSQPHGRQGNRMGNSFCAGG
nr:undecaprenyl-diphosphate phosphatase [Cupriavidus sp. AU9028]